MTKKLESDMLDECYQLFNSRSVALDTTTISSKTGINIHFLNNFNQNYKKEQDFSIKRIETLRNYLLEQKEKNVN